MPALYREMRRIPPSEITPEPLYLNRRRFMAGLGALAAGLLLEACSPLPGAAPAATEAPPAPAGQSKDELGNALTPYAAVTGYNNYYEFSLEKEGVAAPAQGFHASPWQVEVTGLVAKPRTFDLDDLRKLGEEERVYRLRCVEAWSMVIPWLGLPLWKVLELVEPKPEAQYVRFVSVLRPEEMPGQKNSLFAWPYVEGLRLDEAQHDLTIMATGLYGKPLPAQNGAPVRLVVPWKYGFKSSKAIVRIELTAEQPVTFWMAQAPDEYGFYANVNPEVPHPRWSQASERRIGETGRRSTQMFNGYEEQVAELYRGMDLKVNF